MAARDIIVIAGSAGAVQEIRALVGALPTNFPGSVFIVLHTSPEGSVMLAEILDRAGPLPVINPRKGQSIQPGHIYVAPANHHMLILPGHIELGSGPRENGFRPAADPLFRSAAGSYGRRVVGIVLSGGMDDGTLGLQTIKEQGGIAIVQDPDEALNRGMPQSAIRNVKVDYVLSVREIPGLLVELSRHSRAKRGHNMKRLQHQQPDAAMVADLANNNGQLEGSPSPFICPDCGGSLWELKNGWLLHYRCHVGHAYTAETLVAGQNGNVEEALWTALRTLQETAALRRRLADDARAHKLTHVVFGYEERARHFEERAGLIRKVLLNDNLPGNLKGYGTSKPAKVLSRQVEKTTRNIKRRRITG